MQVIELNNLGCVVTVETVVEPGHKRADDEEGDAAIVKLSKHLPNELVLVTVHRVEDERHTHAHNGASEEGHEDHLLLNIDLCAWPKKDSDAGIGEESCGHLVMKYTARPMKATWPSKWVQILPVSV